MSPGIHELALSKKLQISRGSVRHHVRSLVRAQLVQQQARGNKVACFPRGAGNTSQLGLDAHSQAILQVLALRKGLGTQAIADSIRATRKIARVRLAALTRAQLVVRIPGKRPVYAAVPSAAVHPEGILAH